MNTESNSFWRCWKTKTCSNKNPRTNYVDGCSADIDIANKFADHFSVTCDEMNGSLIRPTVYDPYTLYETHDWLFNVDDVRNAICNSLKKGKTAGADNITAEHIIYADLYLTIIYVIYLIWLFIMVMFLLNLDRVYNYSTNQGSPWWCNKVRQLPCYHPLLCYL